MGLAEDLAAVAEAVEQDGIASLLNQVDQGWFEAALAATGKASLRKRRLPAIQVIWLVLAMGLFRKRSIADVAAKLDIALEGVRPCVATSALSKARERLGPAPMEWLFEKTSQEWSSRDSSNQWKGLGVYAIDGTTMSVPDTEQNAKHFGRHRSGKRATESGYPSLRMVWLMCSRSRLVAAARFGPSTTGEITYAKELIDAIPTNSLVILDRLYYAAAMLIPLALATNRHFLLKLKSSAKYTVVETLGDGDDLVEFEVSDEARKKDANLPRHFRARLIRYQPGKQEHLLLTSLLDPSEHSARELCSMYHERWEVELGYDEFKTHLLNEPVLRSRKVAGVEQELWGVLLAYNLVRLEMASIASELEVSPSRISFVGCLWQIRDEMHWLANTSPGAIPKRLRDLRNDLRRFLLPKRRARTFERAVKRKEGKYPRKRSKTEDNALK